MGTELFKHYTADKTPFLKCGYNNLWSVYRGMHKARKLPVCIFVLDKKNLKKITKNKDILTTIRKTATTLGKFRHPNILGLVEPLVEDKACLGFVTERFQYSLSSWLELVNPSKLEIKSVLIEICKSLLFLHEDAHVIHNNLSLDSIFIDENNQIKLGFMEFSVNDPPIIGHEFKADSILQNFSYLAPELIFDEKTFYTSDIYSLGLITHSMLKHSKNEKEREFIGLSQNENNNDAYKKAYTYAESNKLPKMNFDIDDNELLRKCLIKQSNGRPVLKELIEHNWFNDPKLKALNFIEHLDQNDKDKNIEFLQKFPKIIGMFEHKIIQKRFLPALLNGLKNEGLIASCLPPIFAIAEKEELNIQFDTMIWPALKILFSMKSMSGGCLYFLLSKIKFIGSKISNQEFTSNFLNIICKAMDCNQPKIIAVVSDNLLEVTKKIDSLSFKNQIYPRMINILTSMNSNSIKIQLLNSLKSLYTLLDQNIINDNLLNNLEKIRKGDNSADICMSIASIYEDIAKIVSTASIANKILPNLISILVSGNISRGNFESLMDLVHKYLDRIKKDREKDLFEEDNKNNKGDIFDSLANEQKQKELQSNTNNSNALNNDKDDFLTAFFAKPNTIKPQNTVSPISNTNNNTNDNNIGKLDLSSFQNTLQQKENKQIGNTNTNNISIPKTTTPSKQNLDFKSVSNPMAPLQSTNNQNIKNPFSPISNNNTTFNNMNNTKQTNYNNMNIDFTSSNKPTQTTSNTNNQYNFIGGGRSSNVNKQVTLDNLLNDLTKENKTTSQPPTTSAFTDIPNVGNIGFNEMNLDFLSNNNKPKQQQPQNTFPIDGGMSKGLNNENNISSAGFNFDSNIKQNTVPINFDFNLTGNNNTNTTNNTNLNFGMNLNMNSNPSNINNNNIFDLPISTSNQTNNNNNNNNFFNF